MPRTIHMAAGLPASPESHAAVTGAPVLIGADPGAEFRAFHGALQGTILQVVPKHLISQGWELYYFAPWREYLKKR